MGLAAVELIGFMALGFREFERVSPKPFTEVRMRKMRTVMELDRKQNSNTFTQISKISLLLFHILNQIPQWISSIFLFYTSII